MLGLVLRSINHALSRRRVAVDRPAVPQHQVPRLAANHNTAALLEDLHQRPQQLHACMSTEGAIQLAQCLVANADRPGSDWSRLPRHGRQSHVGSRSLTGSVASTGTKSLPARAIGARWHNSSCCRWLPGMTQRPPVSGVASRRVTRPWMHTFVVGGGVGVQQQAEAPRGAGQAMRTIETNRLQQPASTRACTRGKLRPPNLSPSNSLNELKHTLPCRMRPLLAFWSTCHHPESVIHSL
jgi:hypothetical protein